MDSCVEGLMTGRRFLRTGSLHSPSMKSWRIAISACIAIAEEIDMWRKKKKMKREKTVDGL